MEIFGEPDTSPLSDAELADVYALELEAAECLRGLGHTIEVPSLQAFIDGYLSENPFVAHGALGQLSQPDWERANQECPPAAETYQRHPSPRK